MFIDLLHIYYELINDNNNKRTDNMDDEFRCVSLVEKGQLRYSIFTQGIHQSLRGRKNISPNLWTLHAPPINHQSPSPHRSQSLQRTPFRYPHPHQLILIG